MNILYQSERFGHDLNITSMPHVCKANRKLANKFSVEERVGYVHADVALEDMMNLMKQSTLCLISGDGCLLDRLD